MILPLTRRAAMASAAASVAACASPAVLRSPPARSTTPFALGVASGDPAPDGIVLWTRLLANAPGAGEEPPHAPVELVWEVATDERFAAIARSGTAAALPGAAHSVHVEVGGLAPGRPYFYRFRRGGDASPVGRFLTAPAPRAMPASLRFAVCGCNHFEQGWFTAYRHLAAEPDMAFAYHYGDYIYEYATYKGDDRPRRHEGGNVRTLAAYRRRYAQYKADPDLQAAHAAMAFVASFDDHEVVNNWAGDRAAESPGTPADFLARRAAAFQAWSEHMPVRAAQRARGSSLRLHRALAFGDLLALNVLDTRQYRTPQPCEDKREAPCPGAFDPKAEMLGRAQEAWLFAALDGSGARWNALAQQVLMMQARLKDGAFNLDAWDGYVEPRRRIHKFLAERRPGNVVVLSGDWHRNWIGELKADYDDPRSPTLGTEFLGTSISSGGDGDPAPASRARLLRDNPHVRHFSDQRGYLRCTLTPSLWRTDLRTLPYVTRPGAPVATLASFAVEAGKAAVAAA